MSAMTEAGREAGRPTRNGGGGGGGGSSSLSYADVFSAAQPQATFPVLQTRFTNAARLHKDLIDYFAARRDLEEQYLKNLAKLVTKRPLFEAADSPSAVAAGGVYATPSVQPLLDALLKELQSTAAIHTQLEEQINRQIETPLRALPNTHRDWSRIRELDDGLSSQLKELASLESQLDKDRKKLASTPSSNVKKHSQAVNKLNESQQAYDHALALWAAEGPFTFEAYQRIDKARLDALIEAIIQFETAQADAAQRLMKLTEQTTTVALGFEPGSEIRSFLRRAHNSMPKADNAPPPSNSIDGPGANGSEFPVSASTSMPSARLSDSSLPSMANAPSTVGDTSVSTTHSRRPPPPPGQSSSSTGGSTFRGALSRLGGRKARESQFGMPSGRDSASTNTVYGNLPDDDAGSTLGGARPSRTPSIFRSSRTSVDRTADRPRTATTLTDHPGASSAAAASAGLMAPLVPTRAGTKSSSASIDAGTSPSAPPVDAEGFSIPPPDRKPWEITPDSSSRLDEGTEDMLDTSVPPPLPSRVANLSIAGASQASSAPKDTDRDREALERMRSTLGAPLSASADGVTRRSTTSRRERRSTRGFTPQPGLHDDLPEEGSPPPPPPSNFTAPMAGLGGAAQGRTSSMTSTTSGFGLGSPTGPGASSMSIAKAQTQGAAVTALTANPFESAEVSVNSSSKGTVHASITETVNAVFAGPNLVRVQVVGEVQVLLSGNVPGKLNLSLGGPSAINRAVPNPVFLTPAAGEHVYVLDTAAVLSSAGQSEARATVLKYQLDLPAQSNEVVPIDVHAQWRCDAAQTSLMISYRPNASSKLLSGGGGSAPASFDNFEVIVPMSPAGSVTNVMSKPEGKWDAEASKLLWTIAGAEGGGGLYALSPEGETGKLLARVQVEKQSVPQPVNVRWSVKGRTISALELRVEEEGGSGSDGGDWSFEPSEVVRLAVSGKFMAT